MKQRMKQTASMLLSADLVLETISPSYDAEQQF